MYWLTRIGLIDIPKYSRMQTHTIDAVIQRHEGIGGIVTSGSRRQIEPFGVRGVVLSSDLYKALRALIGARQPVYRLDEAGQYTWVWAYVKQVASERQSVDLAQITVSIQLVPATGEDRWRGDRRGAVWELDDGETLDTGLLLDDSAETWELTASVSGTENVIAVPNSGNLAVTDGRWVLTAVGETVTQVAITTSIGTVSWSGDLDDGETLIIDGGAYEITADGVMAFGLAALPLGSTDFSRIAPGGEAVTVKVWANASTGHVLTFEGYDAWA